MTAGDTEPVTADSPTSEVVDAKPARSPAHEVMLDHPESKSDPLDFEGGTSAERAGLQGPGPAFWILAFSVSALVATLLVAPPVAEQLGLPAGRGYFLHVLALIIVARATWFDAAVRLIPNRLTYPAILIGLGGHLLAGPLQMAGLDAAAVWLGFPIGGVPGAMLPGPIGQGLSGLGLCAFIAITSHAARGIGGGDAKLLIGLGALLGYSATWPILINYLPIAAVLGLLNLAFAGGLMARAQVMALNALLVMTARDAKLREIYPFDKNEMPFGVSLLLAMIVTPFFRLDQLLFTTASSASGVVTGAGP
ncbi:MAG: prepilin peptidase [Planctomycetota bacterium]